MGRWAQAQRRGGFTTAPYPTPDGTDFGVEYDDVDGPGRWFANIGSFPAGIDGVVWRSGTAGDPDQTDGGFGDLADHFITNISGDATLNFYAYAWSIAGVPVTPYCSPQPWTSV